jgi:hypothetical protein
VVNRAVGACNLLWGVLDGAPRLVFEAGMTSTATLPWPRAGVPPAQHRQGRIDISSVVECESVGCRW